MARGKLPRDRVEGYIEESQQLGSIIRAVQLEKGPFSPDIAWRQEVTEHLTAVQSLFNADLSRRNTIAVRDGWPMRGAPSTNAADARPADVPAFVSSDREDDDDDDE